METRELGRAVGVSGNRGRGASAPREQPQLDHIKLQGETGGAEGSTSAKRSVSPSTRSSETSRRPPGSLLASLMADDL